jgi:hypothetical protein
VILPGAHEGRRTSDQRSFSLLQKNKTVKTVARARSSSENFLP